MAQAFETGGRRGRDNGRDQFKHQTEEVITDFNELRRDISKLAAAFGKIAQSQFYTAGDQLNHLSHEAQVRAKDSANYASAQVRAKPLSAVGASLGVGFILGLALANLGRR